ncbi:hypothetical protein MRS44_002143 [Fusarium solani]|uniref:uncharacterized protein n=1 Tax=Fusarium solani TaxID=169388 RepID=UPI0032C47ABA|nr:hypothetical protein MRS44_002143 [Fusarium solani]
MSDPGTCLAIVSLALQVSKGLLGYYDLWTHADEDVAEIQRSLLSLANIFTQLEITLGKPNLAEDIISIVRITMKGCDSNVKKLKEMLEKVKREGAPEKLRTKLKNFNRRMLQMFHHGEIIRVQSILNELREDLNMVVSLLSFLDDLRKIHADLTTLQNSDKERIETEKEKNREAQRRALIEWLAAPDISAAHLSAQDQREEGTGDRWSGDAGYQHLKSPMLLNLHRHRYYIALGATPFSLAYGIQELFGALDIKTLWNMGFGAISETALATGLDSLFLVVGDKREDETSDLEWEFATVGYSPIAIMFAVIASLFMVAWVPEAPLVPLEWGVIRKLEPGMESAMAIVGFLVRNIIGKPPSSQDPRVLGREDLVLELLSFDYHNV